MIIFMGVAGAGKSLQGRMLADTYALPWLSTGEFLRMLISGEKRKQMLAGKLLDDKEIISLVRKIFAVVDTNHEFILDGFPRTTSQADWLLGQVKYGQLSVTAVVNLQANEDIVRSRLLNRGRPDDLDEVIDERFMEYHDAVLPILEAFKKANIEVVDINGEQEPVAVHQAIVAALKL